MSIHMSWHGVKVDGKRYRGQLYSTGTSFVVLEERINELNTKRGVFPRGAYTITKLKRRYFSINKLGQWEAMRKALDLASRLALEIVKG
jgi:hypothetical protein